MKQTMKPLLVMGVGNILLTDEGAGIHAVKDLMTEEWPDTVEFLDAGTSTRDLFHRLSNYRHLLVLDIVKSGKSPGAVTCFSESDLNRDGFQRMSMHDLDVFDALDMAELFGHRPLLRLVGIEPENYTDWSTDMTPRLQAALETFKDAARREIRDILSRETAA